MDPVVLAPNVTLPSRKAHTSFTRYPSQAVLTQLLHVSDNHPSPSSTRRHWQFCATNWTDFIQSLESKFGPPSVRVYRDSFYDTKKGILLRGSEPSHWLRLRFHDDPTFPLKREWNLKEDVEETRCSVEFEGFSGLEFKDFRIEEQILSRLANISGWSAKRGFEQLYPIAEFGFARVQFEIGCEGRIIVDSMPMRGPNGSFEYFTLGTIMISNTTEETRIQQVAADLAGACKEGLFALCVRTPRLSSFFGCETLHCSTT